MDNKDIINRILLVKIKRQPVSEEAMMRWTSRIKNTIYSILTDNENKCIRTFEGNVQYYPVFIISDSIDDDYELSFLDDAKVTDEELKLLISELKDRIQEETIFSSEF